MKPLVHFPRPSTTRTPRCRQAFWKARTDPSSVRSDDDRLVEDLVLDEVVGVRDLLEPASHLPDPRPEQLGLQLEEVGVDVPLLRDTVRELHRMGHRKCRPLLVHDCHGSPLQRSVCAKYTNRSVQSPEGSAGGPNAADDPVTTHMVTA